MISRIDSDDIFLEDDNQVVPHLMVDVQDEMIFITQVKENIGLTKTQARTLMYQLAVFVEH